VSRPLTIGDRLTVIAWLAWAVTGYVWRVVRLVPLLAAAMVLGLLWAGDMYLGRAKTVGWVLGNLRKWREA
jgi:hypothetical protein